jgi:hypothetical protein
MTPSKRILSLCCVGLLASASAAHANTMTFDASGTGGDGALDASATFTTSGGQLQVVLTNLLDPSTIVSAGQTLSDISFTLSNGPGTDGTNTATGQQGNISSSGVVTYTAGAPVRLVGQGPPPPGGTGTFTISGDVITLESLGGGQPSELILPDVPNGGTYPDANASIDNGMFDPFTIGPATVTLDLSGVTANTTISDVTFSFGTGPDTFLPGTPVTPPIPEPSSIILLGTGILGMITLVWGRKRFAL